MNNAENMNVSVDSDGNVLKCAKGLTGAQCGFSAGAKICAKCGATPVEMKMVPVSGVEEKSVMSEDMTEDMIPEMSEEMINKEKIKKKKMMKPAPMVEEDEEQMMDEEMTPVKKKRAMPPVPEATEPEMMDEEDENMDTEVEDDEEEMMSEEGKMWHSPKKARRMMGKAEMGDEEDEEDMPEEDMEAEEETPDAEAEVEATEEDEEETPEMMDEEDEEETDEEMGAKAFSPSDSHWDELRNHRIKSMGYKSSDLGATGYVCALERKAYAGSAPVCDDCPGGCVAEKGMPGILHAEGLAEKMFNGNVVDSGYSSYADVFVVDVQTKDGSVKEVFIDGTTAEVMGFHRLDVSEFEQKSDSVEYKLIDFTEAAEIAVKSFDGHVVAVEPDIFEGFDSYAVEIDGFDGKSYDVFVSLDGEILGYDRYEQDEVEAIEAEAAELAIKRAFTQERRMELADSGMAMPDGSYPIVTGSDLRNAIQAFGRAKDKEAAKRHIMKRAKALDMESILPENWKSGSSEKDAIIGSEAVNDAEFLASLAEFQLLEEQIDNNQKN